jgi:hypothetical protein
MNARQRIADLLWWSVPSGTDEEAKAGATELLDAHRAEVLAEAAAAIATERDTANPSAGKGAYRRGMNRAEEVVRALVIQQRLADLDETRERLPLDHPYRHDLDHDADTRFAALACECDNPCNCDTEETP